MFLPLVYCEGEWVCPHTFWRPISIEFFSSVIQVRWQIKYLNIFVEGTVNFNIYSFYLGQLKVVCFDILSFCNKQFQWLFLTMLLFSVLSISFNETWLVILVVHVQPNLIILTRVLQNTLVISHLTNFSTALPIATQLSFCQKKQIKILNLKLNN